MPMTREQENVVREVNTRMSRFLVQGINRQPDAKISQAVARIQETLKAQESLDPRQDIKAWFKPLRSLVDYLDDTL